MAFKAAHADSFAKHPSCGHGILEELLVDVSFMLQPIIFPLFL
jgi:hypothetical protein